MIFVQKKIKKKGRGLTNERPVSGHVIWEPMRGPQPWQEAFLPGELDGAERQTHGHGDLLATGENLDSSLNIKTQVKKIDD